MKVLKDVRHRRTDALAQVRWDQLESLLAGYYREQGYTVDHCGTGATSSRFDGGIDLKLRKDDAYILVQCKHWNAKQVPHNAVHELIGLMVNEGATGAILVTSGEFTRAAIEAATRQGHVQLVDGDDLRGMLGPLPEPAQPTLPQSRSLAQRAAATVGERLLSAVEDRIRYGSHRKSSRKGMVATTARSALTLLLVKIVFALVVFLIIALTLQSAIQAILRPLNSATTTPLVRAQDLVLAPAADASGGVLRNGVRSGQEEVVDPTIGTTSQAVPAGTQPHRKYTGAELRESQRQADEAARIIEASTPEM
ncbi:MAG TPA: restriction endonuclease [Thermomonas sp.]|nr:restriction endonuclease [Thermomonas sp.]